MLSCLLSSLQYMLTLDDIHAPQLNKLADPTRSDVSEPRLDDEIQLLIKSPDDSAVCEEARLVWATCYGAPRSSPAAPRLDTGKRKLENPAGAASEAGFLRRRRSDVAIAANGLDGDQCMQPAERAVGEDGWEASHEAEKTFQLAKRRVRLYECMGEGGVLPSEIEDGVITMMHTTVLNPKP
jgi:hypothetical protein